MCERSGSGSTGSQSGSATVVTSQHGGDDCGQANRIVASLSGSAVEQGSSVFDRRHCQQTYPQHRHRIVEVSSCRVDDVRRVARQEPPRAGVDSGHRRGQCAVDLQSPHVLEAAVARQLGRVVLPVMEETLLTSHGTEVGIRYSESFQTRWRDLKSHVLPFVGPDSLCQRWGLAIRRHEYAGVEDSLRIEVGLGPRENLAEQLGTLLLVPRLVIAADGVMVGDGASVVDHCVGDDTFYLPPLLQHRVRAGRRSGKRNRGRDRPGRRG